MIDEWFIIEQAKKGDARAFEILIEKHQKRIFSIAYRIAGNQEDAADMTQEVLIKIFRNIKKFKGKSKFSTWLYRVATNTCLDEVKKLNKQVVYSLQEEIETEDGKISAEIADTAMTPEERLEQREIRGVVNIAISMLSDEHKKIIILREIEGFSYDEIAAILKCSAGTVKSRISRAREQLRNILLKDKELFLDYFVKLNERDK